MNIWSRSPYWLIFSCWPPRREIAVFVLFVSFYLFAFCRNQHRINPEGQQHKKKKKIKIKISFTTQTATLNWIDGELSPNFIILGMYLNTNLSYYPSLTVMLVYVFLSFFNYFCTQIFWWFLWISNCFGFGFSVSV